MEFANIPSFEPLNVKARNAILASKFLEMQFSTGQLDKAHHLVELDDGLTAIETPFLGFPTIFTDPSDILLAIQVRLTHFN